MKKFVLFFISIILVFSVSAQKNYRTISEATGMTGSAGNRTILCPEGSLFSHQVNYVNGISALSGIFQVYDQIEPAPGAPVGQVIFYGVANGEFDRNFTVSFYLDNAGSPGSLITSYTSFLTGVNTGETAFGLTIYSYTFVLPTSITINAEEFISVEAANGENWFWMTGSGGNGCFLQVNGLGYNCEYGDMAFCLLGGEVAPVPITNWALFIGIGLILVFAIVRFRKLM
jgi:hypothetical protein